VNTVFQRIFGTSKPESEPASGLPLDVIQVSLREALLGCHGVRADRLLYKIDIAKTPSELWGLRSDLHQCIAQVHTEGIAAHRINELSAVFAGWIPAAQLVKIQQTFKPSRP
jgi:hypothetical protein